MHLKNFLLTALVTILFFSCTKGPGEGGNSIIRGKIYAYNYNTVGTLVGEGYSGEDHVYLVFGDDAFYSLDTKSGYDGTYEFPYLKKGTYTVYAYSKCDTCGLGNQAILQTVDVVDNHSTVVVPDIKVNH